MKAFSILGGKVHVVELPEGATDPFVAKTYIDEDGHVYNTAPQWLEWSGTYPDSALDLPPGTWQIVGRLSELFYHDFDGLIEPAKVFDYTAHYWNYIEKEYQPIMQIESLESAILAEGYSFSLPDYPDINDPKFYDEPYDGTGFYQEIYSSALDDYHEAQSRVLSRERCLLLRRVDG